MMSLFQTPQVTEEIDLSHLIRQQLSAALNKGIILQWDELKDLLPINSDFIVARNLYEVLIENRPLITMLNSLTFTECYLHQPGVVRYQDQSGVKHELSFEVDQESWQIWLEIMAVKYLQNWNCQNPFVSFRVELADHPYRFSMVHFKATSSPFSKLMIRNLQVRALALEAFHCEMDLSGMVRDKLNILVCGSTGSGKTSLLNSMLATASAEEHIIVLEDTQEIVLPHSFCTRFLAQEHEAYRLEDFLTYSLRLSPDRIVLGEMRSSEVVTYLLSMNTGHKGLMSTIHANSAVDGMHRVAMMFNLYGKGLNPSEVMSMITKNIDIIIFMENKKVKEIIKPLGSDLGQPYFETLFSR